jgi:hypothetical protein
MGLILLSEANPISTFIALTRPVFLAGPTSMSVNSIPHKPAWEALMEKLKTSIANYFAAAITTIKPAKAATDLGSKILAL